jgi:hypothetical protein
VAIELIGGQLFEEQPVGNGDRHITTTSLSERHFDATEIMPPPNHPPHHHCYWRRRHRRSRTSSWTSSNRHTSSQLDQQQSMPKTSPRKKTLAVPTQPPSL